jgi:hypothetical protein
MRVEDRKGLPALVLHLVLGLQLFLGVDAVADGTRVLIRHGEELDRPALLACEQPTGLVGERGESVLDHLVEEGAFEFDHCRCNNPTSAVVFPERSFRHRGRACR